MWKIPEIMKSSNIFILAAAAFVMACNPRIEVTPSDNPNTPSQQDPEKPDKPDDPD